MKFFILSIILISKSFLFSENIPPGAFSITRIHYGGGGDWYSDPSSLPNLLEYLSDHANLTVNPIEKRAKIGDDIFSQSSYLYLTGHGNINFNEEELQSLRDHLMAGAFLHADDNFGMDKSFRREMKKCSRKKIGLNYLLNILFLIFTINSQMDCRRSMNMKRIPHRHWDFLTKGNSWCFILLNQI